MRIYIDVPFHEKDAAKALGARWDAEFRCWYVGAGLPVQRFARWIRADMSVPGPTVNLPVLLLRVACWQCQGPTTCVVGLLVPEESDWEPSVFLDDIGYLALEDCAPVMAQLLDPALCTRIGIGPLQRRRTRPRPDGYLANTCVHCGATQGAFPLYQMVVALDEEGDGGVASLWADGVVVDYPEALLPRWDEPPSSDEGAKLADSRSNSPRS